MACDCDCMMRKRIAKLEEKVKELEEVLQGRYDKS